MSPLKHQNNINIPVTPKQTNKQKTTERIKTPPSIMILHYPCLRIAFMLHMARKIRYLLTYLLTS
jgi:hypothetical protein